MHTSHAVSNTSSEGLTRGFAMDHPGLVVFIRTACLIVIVVAGSLWVMHNANVNMMPAGMSAEQARAHE
jgi:hypothetical protein